ncbi:hypothetical protein FF36_02649 [Frankia torreyi]|uniref:Uncharacterized protein n=1 Tax=Frankia torreyi TaxID=1856 RepID=A0A0D8BHX8_9ACTN|nr:MULTISPECIES: hypothetical protein [Frankia]KJE23047.1 hypothetical protein FF36_02649 [Frankia torreyi]
MTTDETTAAWLRAAAGDLRAHPSEHIWTSVEARVSGERRRRAARRTILLVTVFAAAVTSAAVAFGGTRTGSDDHVSLLPAAPPPSHTITSSTNTAVHLSPAEKAAIPLECAQSGPGKADPARSPTFGLIPRAAVRDNVGISMSVLLAIDSTTTECEIPLDAAGRPDISLAYGFMSITAPTRSAPDPVSIDVSGSHEFGGLDRPDDPRRVHTAGGLVSTEVARITATTPDGQTIQVPIQDGFFIMRSVQVDGPEPTDKYAVRHWLQSRAPVLRFYDGSGRLLKTATAG